LLSNYWRLYLRFVWPQMVSWTPPYSLTYKKISKKKLVGNAAKVTTM
jgi:hypothetical protein